MIRGLDHFKDAFKDYVEDYVFIGGVATYLQLQEMGANKIRATKDLDIVIMMNPREEFLKAIRNYVKDAEYKIQKTQQGKALLYRFQGPKSAEYPIMIELFSTIDKKFELFEGQRIVPILNSGGIGSLSAILLDSDYFALIKKNSVIKNDIGLLNPFALIPFKAKAYLDIKSTGRDSKQWKKHRSDVINLSVNFLTEDTKEKLSGQIRNDFLKFLDEMKSEVTSNIIEGACNQKVEKSKLLELMESTFLE